MDVGKNDIQGERLWFGGTSVAYYSTFRDDASAVGGGCPGRDASRRRGVGECCGWSVARVRCERGIGGGVKALLEDMGEGSPGRGGGNGGGSVGGFTGSGA